MGWLSNMFSANKKTEEPVKTGTETAGTAGTATGTDATAAGAATPTVKTASGTEQEITSSAPYVAPLKKSNEIKLNESKPSGFDNPKPLIDDLHLDGTPDNEPEEQKTTPSTAYRDAFGQQYGGKEPEEVKSDNGIGSWKEFVDDYNPFRKRQTEEEKARYNHRWAQVGDAISSIANLYWTTKGAPNAYDKSSTMSAKTKERWDKLKAERDKKIEEYRKGAMRAAEQDLVADAAAEDRRIARENNALKMQAAREKLEETERNNREKEDIARQNASIARQNADSNAKRADAAARNAQANETRAKKYGAGTYTKNSGGKSEKVYGFSFNGTNYEIPQSNWNGAVINNVASKLGVSPTTSDVMGKTTMKSKEIIVNEICEKLERLSEAEQKKYIALLTGSNSSSSTATPTSNPTTSKKSGYKKGNNKGKI